MRREANNHHGRSLHKSLHENHSILNPYPSHLPLVEITSLPSILYTNSWPIRRLRECYKRRRKGHEFGTSFLDKVLSSFFPLTLALFLPSTIKNLQDTSRTFKKDLSRISRDEGAYPIRRILLILQRSGRDKELFRTVDLRRSAVFKDRAVTRSYSVRWIWEEVPSSKIGPWQGAIPYGGFEKRCRDSIRVSSRWFRSVTRSFILSELHPLETRNKDLSVRGKETRSFTSRLSQLGVLFFNYLITCSLIGFCCVKNESCLNSRLRLFTCHLWSKSCSLLLSFYSLFSSILVLNKLVKILQIQIPIQSINRQTKPTFQRQSVMTHWIFRHDAQEVSPLTFSLLFSPSWRTLPSVMTHRWDFV